jgi:hypothetical protein
VRMGDPNWAQILQSVHDYASLDEILSVRRNVRRQANPRECSGHKAYYDLDRPPAFFASSHKDKAAVKERWTNFHRIGLSLWIGIPRFPVTDRLL